MGRERPPSQVTDLFQAGGPLSPRSTAFDASIYRRDSGRFAHAQDALHFHPQVIGSPRLSGKTTQVYTIASYHRKLAGRGGALIVICDMAGVQPTTDPVEQGVNEASLRSVIAARLATSPHGSLRDILRRSPLLGRTRTVLAITNSEKIGNAALRWLLTGFKAVYEDEHLRLGKEIHLLIDGSFAVETLTAGPDSDYPLPQAYPPEFTESEQSVFLVERLQNLRLRPTESALRFLWKQTMGDKYLTQAVGCHFWKDAPRRVGRSPVTIDVRELRVPLEDEKSWSGLFHAASGAIGSLALDFSLRYQPTETLMDRLIPEWQQLSPAIRATAYDGGLVRRTSPTKVQIRAPMMPACLQGPLRNVNRVLGLLHSSFSLSGVAPEDYNSAKSALVEILRGSARNNVVTVHAGHGHVASEGVKVNAIALDGGRYEATWITPTHRFRLGTPVWALSWTILRKRGRRTESQVFKMKGQPNDGT